MICSWRGSGKPLKESGRDIVEEVHLFVEID